MEMNQSVAFEQLEKVPALDRKPEDFVTKEQKTMSEKIWLDGKTVMAEITITIWQVLYEICNKGTLATKFYSKTEIDKHVKKYAFP